MALIASDLAAAIINAVGLQASDQAGRDAMTKLAQAIDEHIKRATVTVTVTGSAATGTGPAPVTGTGTGSLS